MNQRSHPDESNSKDRMAKKGLKEFENYYTRCTFLFGDSIIGTPRLNVHSLEQLYVG